MGKMHRRLHQTSNVDVATTYQISHQVSNLSSYFSAYEKSNEAAYESSYEGAHACPRGSVDSNTESYCEAHHSRGNSP